MPRRDPETFALAQAAVAGAQVPFDPDLAMSMLRFTILKDDAGCDVVITDDDFIVHDKSHGSSRHRLDAAPGVICKLGELAGARVVENQSFVIGPATLEFFGQWSFTRKRIWFRSTPTQITILVRDAFSSGSSPEPVPPSMERPITYIELDASCPHCGVRSQRYRELRDGALVCGPCGASFERTVELPTARLLR